MPGTLPADPFTPPPRRAPPGSAGGDDEFERRTPRLAGFPGAAQRRTEPVRARPGRAQSERPDPAGTRTVGRRLVGVVVDGQTVRRDRQLPPVTGGPVLLQTDDQLLTDADGVLGPRVGLGQLHRRP